MVLTLAVAPTIRRNGLRSPCIVGAGLAPALWWCGAIARETLMRLASTLWWCGAIARAAPMRLAPALWWCGAIAREALPFALLGLAPALWRCRAIHRHCPILLEHPNPCHLCYDV